MTDKENMLDRQGVALSAEQINEAFDSFSRPMSLVKVLYLEDAHRFARCLLAGRSQDGTISADDAVAGIIDLFPSADRQALNALAEILCKPALSRASSSRAEVETGKWQPITAPGQVKAGDRLSFTIGDETYTETAKLILDAGTDKEEIIYNKARNFYLITSMAMQNRGSQKNVLFYPLAAAEAPKGEVKGGN